MLNDHFTIIYINLQLTLDKLKSLEAELSELREACADIPSNCKLEDDDSALLAAVKLLESLQNETKTKEQFLQVCSKKHFNYKF